MKKISKRKKHVDNVVNSIQYLLLPIKNTLSNTHNNTGPQVDCFETNLSTCYCADQDVVYDENSYSNYRTTSYPTDSVFFNELNHV